MYTRSIICFLILLTMSSCNLVHKADIEQGNIITVDMANQLHTGMTEAQVKEVMGNPVLKNIFSTQRIDYIYTMQKGHGQRLEKRLICIFKNGRLSAIQSSASYQP